MANMKVDEKKSIELKCIKDIYPGYFFSNPDKLLKNAVLVLDTNIYLNLIDFPTELSEKLISIFNKFNSESRLFVPGTVGYEVIKQLDHNLNALEQQYNTIDNKLDECIFGIESIFTSKGKKSFPIKDTKEILDLIKSHFTNLKNEINEKKEPKKDKNKLRESIIELMNNVGPCYSEEEKKELKVFIQSKLEQKLYPGYKEKKEDITKNNDGYIWHQTIQYSKNNNKDIIFVTADIKEDWFNINSETKERSIRQPMINDFMVSSGHKIQLLLLDDFLSKYNKQLSEEEKIDSKSLKDMIFTIKDAQNFINVSTIENPDDSIDYYNFLNDPITFNNLNLASQLTQKKPYFSYELLKPFYENLNMSNLKHKDYITADLLDYWKNQYDLLNVNENKEKNLNKDNDKSQNNKTKNKDN